MNYLFIPFRTRETITKVNVSSQSCQFLRNLMMKEAVFPTRANRWITLESKPILCDDDSAELEKLFSHDLRVHLLNMADKDRLGRTIGSRGRSGGARGEHVRLFLEACQIQTLTECVEREFIPTMLQPSPNVQLFLHTICPYIQMFISMRSQVGGCEVYVYVYEGTGRVYSTLLWMEIDSNCFTNEKCLIKNLQSVSSVCKIYLNLETSQSRSYKYHI